MQKKIFATIGMGLALFSLVACDAAPPSSTSNADGTKIGKTVKIGLNLELTGPVSAYGSAEKVGAMMAVAEINKAGGINGKKMKSFQKITNQKMLSLLLSRLAWQPKIMLMSSSAPPPQGQQQQRLPTLRSRLCH